MLINPKTAKALSRICTSPSECRPELGCAQYRANGPDGYATKGPVLVATDGTILAVVSVEKNDDEMPTAHAAPDVDGALIPSAVLAKAQPFSKRLFAGKSAIKANGTVKSVTIDGFTETAAPDVQFPDVSHVAFRKDPVFSIALDAGKLLTLAAALDEKAHVVLRFSASDQAVKVESMNSDNEGLIMPLRMD